MKNYKKFTRKQMSRIGKKVGFYFIETSNGDDFIISKTDLVDFIIQETNRCKHNVDIYVYVPSDKVAEPILTTYGWFLDKVNPKLRSEIIGRLVSLQNGNSKPRKIKIFDYDVFRKMKIEEFGEKKGQSIQFDKFFKKYYE